MNESKFTPGPWVVKSDEWGIKVQCKGPVLGLPFAVTPICEIEQDEDTGGIEDAHLIAAAPDLLDALNVMLEHVYGHCLTEGDCNQARAAIAKAEGRG